MKYRVSILRQDRTDVRPVTFGIGGRMLWGFVVLLVLFPFVSFWVVYTYIAPQALAVNMVSMKEAKNSALSEANNMAAQQVIITEENKLLRDNLRQERELRAGLESKITIAETARADLGEKAGELEAEVLNLRRSVRFYEQFTKPANEQAPLQCFNVKASEAAGKVQYSVNMIKKNRKDKNKITVKLQFRVLAGASARQIDLTANDAKALHNRSVTFTYDTSLSGSFAAADIPKGVRLLDIKGYDAKGEIVGHCWQSF